VAGRARRAAALIVSTRFGKRIGGSLPPCH